MTAHTPGPWGLCLHLQSAEKDASCPCGFRGGIWGSDGEHAICEMGSTRVVGEEGMEAPRYARPVELANARLIAAAPNLLAALQDCADDLEAEIKAKYANTISTMYPTITRSHARDMATVTAARAAIARATGAA